MSVRWSCCRRAASTTLGPVDAGAHAGDRRGRRHAGRAGASTPGPPASTRRSTSPAATRRPSAAPSPPTPAARGSCASARCAPRSPASTAVLADGSMVGSLAGLPKETVGIHWPSLLAGSEGTLGVVTAARLRLVPWYRHTATAMVATASLDDAVAVLAALRAGVPHLDAVELILPEAMDVVAAHLGADAAGRRGRRRRRLRRRRVRRPRRPDRRADSTRSPAVPAVLDAAVTHRGPGPRPAGRVPRPDHRVDQRARACR